MSLDDGFGAAADFVPVAGDVARRGANALANQWQLGAQARIDAGIAPQNRDTFTARERQPQALANEWTKASPGSGSNAR
ncbi:hypothetical protein ACWC98_33290 [Streptomyces goshikiensis]